MAGQPTAAVVAIAEDEAAAIVQTSIHGPDFPRRIPTRMWSAANWRDLSRT